SFLYFLMMFYVMFHSTSAIVPLFRINQSVLFDPTILKTSIKYWQMLFFLFFFVPSPNELDIHHELRTSRKNHCIVPSGIKFFVLTVLLNRINFSDISVLCRLIFQLLVLYKIE